MRAIVLRKTGGPEELVAETVGDPTASGDDVLVRVRASAVCGRDLIDRRGGFPLMKLPTVLGHEFAGEVVAVGESAAATSSLRPGDRVVNLHRPICLSCRFCLAGQTLFCERAWQSFGHTIDGAYAELVVAHHRALVKIPEDLPFDAASTLMCTAGVALRAMRRARLTLGETVLITGASGGVGAAAVQLAKRMGARVVATTSNPAKAESLRGLGAHEVIVSPDSRFHAEVLRRTDGGADVCVELTGSVTFASAIRSLRRAGRMVVVGNIEPVKIELNLGAMILYGYEIVGSASCTRQDLEDVIALTRSGEYRPLIDRTLPLESAAEAHRLLADRAVVGRVVLVP
jgi:acryloyl-coenzyme A reductase